MPHSVHKPPPNAKSSLGMATLAHQEMTLEQHAAELHRREERCVEQFEVDEVEDVVRLVELSRMVETIRILEDENRQLRDQLELVKPVFAVGVDVRSRLFAHAKPLREPRDAEIIRQGNCAAHRGRPRADAVLCMQVLEPREQACDIYLYLYGVHPSWALTWLHLETVDDVLECRGSLVVEKIPLSNTFHELFKQFICRVEERGETDARGLIVLSTCYDILKEYDEIVAAIPGKKMVRST